MLAGAGVTGFSRGEEGKRKEEGGFEVSIFLAVHFRLLCPCAGLQPGYGRGSAAPSDKDV